uniref:Otopetrin 3 n=1 Tax=Cyclopterus lumpus TaxID=8103 RepID=A0A8C2YX49_CYCLU
MLSQSPDTVPAWAPSGKRLISGLLGLNLVLLGAALVAGGAFNPDGLKHEEPQVFMLLLMGVSLIWMLWYLLWARKQPGISPHKDHHAGGVPVTGEPVVCVSDSVSFHFLLPGVMNSTLCQCTASAACLIFRKGFEVLYPFNMEFYLMAGCMVYVMWKNVGRGTSPDHRPHVNEKLTLRAMYRDGVLYGLAAGALVLAAGVTVFILYQVWVSRRLLRHTAFLIFYGYHLAVMPAMSLCCLAGMLVHRLERRENEAGRNPTRSLDVTLLVGAALGQLALSYFSLVAAMAVGTGGTLGDLDLSYSLLSLLELILQNIFIIEGLHRHPSLLAKRKERRRSNVFKVRRQKKTNASLLDGNAPAAAKEHDGKKPWTKRAIQEICAFLILSNVMVISGVYYGIHAAILASFCTANTPPPPCSPPFLQLWVIPAFGVHPQFENGLGKQFFGFSAWFVLVNLGQPLSVFYRMHSVGALVELLIAA